MLTGTKLREARRRKGITIVEFARLTGLSQADIVRIERGELQPSVGQVAAQKAVIDAWRKAEPLE